MTLCEDRGVLDRHRQVSAGAVVDLIAILGDDPPTDRDTAYRWFVRSSAHDRLPPSQVIGPAPSRVSYWPRGRSLFWSHRRPNAIDTTSRYGNVDVAGPSIVTRRGHS